VHGVRAERVRRYALGRSKGALLGVWREAWRGTEKRDPEEGAEELMSPLVERLSAVESFSGWLPG
jgi:hypothetical protein